MEKINCFFLVNSIKLVGFSMIMVVPECNHACVDFRPTFQLASGHALGAHWQSGLPGPICGTAEKLALNFVVFHDAKLLKLDVVSNGSRTFCTSPLTSRPKLALGMLLWTWWIQVGNLEDAFFLRRLFFGPGIFRQIFTDGKPPGIVPAFWRAFDGFSNWSLPSRKAQCQLYLYYV